MPTGKKPLSGGDVADRKVTAENLAEHLISRAPTEDIAAYDDEALRRTSELAFSALKQHRKGDCIIAVDRDPGILRQGRKVSVVTLVNDNMPFLFDSVIGEITDGGAEPLLVMHPVLQVTHGKAGVTSIVGDSGGGRHDAGVDRVSLIHIHLPVLTEARATALEAALKRILEHVRLAVADWKPMLARLEQAISSFRYSDVPLKKDAVEEAVALLEWLRDDNFTFLGMRDFIYKGDEKTGKLDRSDSAGLGILADPDLRVLRSGTEAVTTTPEIRAFLNGPDPLIVTKANTKSLVHRRIYLDYVGVKTFNAKGKLLGELRIVGLFTSTAYTRSVMKIPYLRSKANTVIARSGFDPGDHSGKALINLSLIHI